ncbi:LCP family protein [Actinomadura sp. DC4]|uniref:LCP family protein n=1 Tax=Actinomadura sp. DC4 TaxID=3055069 RepID=UPI0025B17A04|nr:LCP family protein [Actinomadura sp. DC4]MDN3357397.1 LCP family protein [Actinomadura sp. DC4]
MASGQYGRPPTRRREPIPVAGLWRALGLTSASAVVWGIAHVSVGRRATGFGLMGLLAALVLGGAAAVLAFQEKLKQLVVQGFWLNVIIAGILVLAAVWALVVIRSFQVTCPPGLPSGMRYTSGALVVLLALMICTPLVYAANATYVLRDTLSSIFPGDDKSGASVNASNPWKNKPRVNILLLGGDGGKDRTGIRTDSMTVASIDTKTGNTVLLSLPRALREFQMPPKMRTVWPNGYTGDYGPNGTCPISACLLNELYIQGEKRHPELEPGYTAGQRGPHMLEDVIGYLTGLKMDYYVLVNLAGFKDIVNAMGGVQVNVKSSDGKWLPIGGDPDRGIPPSGYLKPGRQHLDGEHALWYGRTRHADDDFRRMDRQKCLMKAIADQADPQKVVTHFEKLANAAKSTISTNIPAKLLPALIKLSGTVKHGADVSSLSYDPDKIPGFHTNRPADAAMIQLMRRTAANAIAKSTQPSATPTTTRKKTTTAGSALSLKDAC